MYADDLNYWQTSKSSPDQAGFTPTAMLWRDEGGYRNKEWSNFQRRWARPRLIYMKDDQKRLSLEVR